MLVHHRNRCAVALALIALAALPGRAAGQTLFGPTPYLSTADIPVGFYQGGSPTFLDNLEDGRLDGNLTGSAGSVIGPGQFNGLRDSVDGDDGSIDGSGVTGSSWFSGSGSTGVTFTFNGNTLPTAFGLVWTDGAGTITFKAFDGSGALLLAQTFSGIPDGSISGTTGEDRFFGAQSAAGIGSIFISNSSGGIEIDHIQYGDMPIAVPEPETWALLGAGLGLLGFTARRRSRAAVPGLGSPAQP